MKISLLLSNTYAYLTGKKSHLLFNNYAQIAMFFSAQFS